MSYPMSPAEREQFLAQPHVGVLSVVEDGAPLSAPVWYVHQPGGSVVVITGRESRKVRAVRASGWLSLCAQSEAWRYEYVTASGPAVISGPASHADQHTMASRYRGNQGADRYMTWVTDSGEADEQVIIDDAAGLADGRLRQAGLAAR